MSLLNEKLRLKTTRIAKVKFKPKYKCKIKLLLSTTLQNFFAKGELDN